eukprot:scaffold5706_cov124-Isochrysis_galbana.AAC.5
MGGMQAPLFPRRKQTRARVGWALRWVSAEETEPQPEGPMATQSAVPCAANLRRGLSRAANCRAAAPGAAFSFRCEQLHSRKP